MDPHAGGNRENIGAGAHIKVLNRLSEADFPPVEGASSEHSAVVGSGQLPLPQTHIQRSYKFTP